MFTHPFAWLLAWLLTISTALCGLAVAVEDQVARTGGQPAPTERSPHGYTRNVAVLVFEGVELLDFAGPVEVFTKSGGWDTPLRVYTVAATPQPLKTGNQVRVVPDYTIADCPPPDILVIPGGETRCLGGDQPLGRFIREQVPRVEIVCSICNGAFSLAEAGFLDGLEATTHSSMIGWLRQAAPRTVVHANRRYVDNGKVMTVAGVSAGIDGALYLVDRLLGPEAARGVARGMDYEWNHAPPPRAAADQIERARFAWYAGSYRTALTEYRALVADHPDDAIARVRLGTCLVFTGNAGEGLEHLERAKQLGANHLRLHHAIGIALMRLGRSTEAVVALEEALELDPTCAEVIQSLGMAQADAGYLQEAIANLEKCWELNRGDAGTWVAIARAKTSLGDRAGAIAALTRAADEGHAALTKLLQESAFDPLREEAAFQALVRRAVEPASRK